MKELQQYFEAEKAVHVHIGYQEDWHVYPLSDMTNCAWFVSGGKVYFLYEDKPNTQYQDYMIDNKLYEGEKYTGILVNTQTDGNCFLYIFSNDKRNKYYE